jgi:hypothetical protein
VHSTHLVCTFTLAYIVNLHISQFKCLTSCKWNWKRPLCATVTYNIQQEHINLDLLNISFPLNCITKIHTIWVTVALEKREYGHGDPLRWPHDTLYPQKVGTNFAHKRRSLGQYSSLADSSHRVFFRGYSMHWCGWRELDATEMLRLLSSKMWCHVVW